MFLSVISSCEQLFLILWHLSPRLATHFSLLNFSGKTTYKYWGICRICWKHGASRRLEKPTEWYPFALKSLAARAVMVDKSRQDFARLTLYVDAEPEQGQEGQTFTLWLTFLFRSWRDFLPAFVKHSAILLQLWGVFSGCSDGLQLRSESVRHHGLTGVPYLQGPWIPYSCGESRQRYRELKWLAIIEGKVISNKFSAIKTLPLLWWKTSQSRQNTEHLEVSLGSVWPGLSCRSLWCGMETLGLIGLHSTHSQRDRFCFPGQF